MIEFYKFQADWTYSDWDYNEEIMKTSYGIVAAETYWEAIEKIINRLPNASNIHIDKYDKDTDFLFMTKENFDYFSNSEWGFDEPEEDCHEF